jgi:hypothetical protein
MKAATALVVLLATSALPTSRAAEETASPTTIKDLLKARIAEDARKTPPPTTTKGAAKPAPGKTAATAERAADGSAPTATNEKPSDTTPPAAKAPATVMPKMEVKKGRITVLDQKLAEQEKEIERERKNLKASEVDTALNDMKIAKPLAIFGGDSAQFRQRVASERVELMEAEKDIIEAIAQARTKEEKAELQKQLDELKAMRRQLDKSLR